MLNNRFLDDRTYEQRYSEAINNIPLYTKEWTNFNPSDPGITTLENILAFLSLQQSQIDRITPSVKRNLLKMVGMVPHKERCARVLLSAKGLSEPMTIPAGHVFKCGDLTFETPKLTTLYPYNITGVIRKNKNGFSRLKKVLDDELNIPESVFGEKPAKDDCIYFIMDNMPKPHDEIILYVKTTERMSRNPFPDKGSSLFSEIVWECFTDEGFVKMNTLDRTGGFLIDGDIRVRLPDMPAALCPECDNKYVIRARLLWADYDVEPKVTSVHGFLFELHQKETLSVLVSGNKLPRLNIYNNIMDLGYVRVFVKEDKGESYHEYTRAPYEGAKGRYFDYSHEGPGMHSFYFDKKEFGYGPGRVRDAVKILAYTESIMRRYSLDTVYGYDDQVMDLPEKHIVGDSFSLLARRVDPESEGNEYIYDFLRPGRDGEGAFRYHLLENEGRIIIEDCGDFIGAELFVGGFSVTRGHEGNVRPNIEFVSTEPGMEFTLTNPGPGTGGCYTEDLEDVRKNFLADIRKPYSAVTENDYELIVKETPQLIIHKVKAFRVKGENLVKIAVKPGADEPFPMLSKVYRDTIKRRLESRRLLNTRIEISGPVYVPIEVRGTVYARHNYGDVLEEIEGAIKNEVDYMRAEKNFGDVLYFSDVFHAVESLDCVKYIYDLHMVPRAGYDARMEDADIIPGQNCLCYVGSINIEISN